MANVSEIRLRLLGHLIPVASRHGLTGDEIINTARALEKYVLDSAQQGEGEPASPARRTLTRPRKGQPADAPPAFLTPPHGGQVDSSPR